MKKTPENDLLRLRHMLEAAEKIRQFTTDKARADLNSNEVLALALVRLIEIIGEAASQVTDATRLENPDIPWADMIGMRNRVIHGYFDIELDIVWDTVKHNIPSLITQLELLVPPESEK